MTPDRIKKIRALAKRGVGGEKENAIKILTNLGIPIEEPKNSISDRFKSVFGSDIKRSYHVDINFSTDLIFIEMLVRKITNGSITIVNDWRVKFSCTQAEMKDISKIFEKHKYSFKTVVKHESEKYIRDYMADI